MKLEDYVEKPLVWSKLGKVLINIGEETMKTIYLAGPIFCRTDQECNDWREYIMQRLQGKFNFFNPMVRDYRGREDGHASDIVEPDKEEISSSDIVLANCFMVSSGTAMEILYASDKGKLVLVIAPQGFKDVSPWIKYHATKMFSSVAEAADHLLGLFTIPTLVERFWDQLSPESGDFFEEPTQISPGIFRMLTKKHYTFDVPFWKLFHKFPFHIHSILRMHNDIYDLRFGVVEGREE